MQTIDQQHAIASVKLILGFILIITNTLVYNTLSLFSITIQWACACIMIAPMLAFLWYIKLTKPKLSLLAN